jgi:lariat debranching enzyme
VAAPIAFAVAGDIHGDHRALIAVLEGWIEAAGQPLAFVLQVGDFEPIRDERDLQSVAGPPARRKLGDFHEVVAGRLRYPAEVIFVGGNHEPYGWLEAFPAGGELLPGITYLGRAGRVERAGLRIAGLSGILSLKRYGQPIPADWLARRGTLKEPTYFRESEFERLLASGPADILLTHDWPSGMAGPYGNTQSRVLLQTLRPRYHFAGHIHRPLRKTVTHPDGTTTEFVALNHVGLGPRAVLFLGWDGSELRELGWDDPGPTTGDRRRATDER